MIPGEWVRKVEELVQAENHRGEGRNERWRSVVLNREVAVLRAYERGSDEFNDALRLRMVSVDTDGKRRKGGRGRTVMIPSSTKSCILVA